MARFTGWLDSNAMGLFVGGAGGVLIFAAVGALTGSLSTAILGGSAGVLVGFSLNSLTQHRRSHLGLTELLRVPISSIAEIDPTKIGVAPAAQGLMTGGARPTYLPREVDSKLRTEIQAARNRLGPWVVVVTGAAKVGKSRSLYEALLACGSDDALQLVAPVDVDAIVRLSVRGTVAQRAGTCSVLWLDDLKQFFEQGLTMNHLRSWRASGNDRVVVATFDRKGGARSHVPAGDGLATIAKDVLGNAAVVTLTATGSAELDSLRGKLPTVDLESIDRYGLAAYLVSAEALERKLYTGRSDPGEEPERPDGVAVVYAATDWIRCGRTDPLPKEILFELWPSYLPEAVAVTADRPTFESALAWARQSVSGSIALIEGDVEYRVNDYVVRLIDDGPSTPAPRSIAWARAIRGSTDAQALAVGASAYLHGRNEDAAVAFRAAGLSSIDEVAASADFNLGLVLGALGRPVDALAAYSDLVRRFGDAEESFFKQLIAETLVNRGVVLDDLNRHDEGIASYREVVTRFDDARDPELRVQVAAALFNVACSMAELGRSDDQLAAYDEMLRRFEHERGPKMDVLVAKTLMGRGVLLKGAERIDESAAAYMKVVEIFGDSLQPELREIVAAALTYHADALLQAGDFEKALIVSEDLLRRFDHANEIELQQRVAVALINNGRALDRLGRSAEASAAYDAVTIRFSDRREPALRAAVATALLDKGLMFDEMKRPDEAVATYDEVALRFGEATDSTLRLLMARALISKGNALGTIARSEEAVAVYDELIARYADAPESDMKEIVEEARLNRGLTVGALSRSSVTSEESPETVESGSAAFEQRDLAKFERNVRSRVCATALRLEGIEMFADQTWELNPSVNILLGRNGFGKSLLLRILAGMLQADLDASGDLFQGRGLRGRITLEVSRGSDEREMLARDRSAFERASIGKVPLLAIPDARFMDQSSTTVSDPGAVDLVADGALHFLRRRPYQAVVDGLLSGLALDYYEHGSFEQPSFSLINEALARLTGQSFRFTKIERVGRTASRIWIRPDGLDRDVEIQQASQGTLSTVAMVGMIDAFLRELADARRAPDGEACNEHAIVLIDEVDAHLHPLWQQKVRNLLTDLFPNVQFLLSAHSPLIVAGCGPGEVSVLRREKQGFAVEHLRDDFVGVSAQHLYEQVFEVEDIDETFVEYALKRDRGEDATVRAELDDLLHKGELTADEQGRQDELMLDLGRMSRVAVIQEQRLSADQRAVSNEAEIARLRHELSQAERKPASSWGEMVAEEPASDEEL